MKNSTVFLSVFMACILITSAACNNGSYPNCSDLDATYSKQGVCETTGIVQRSEDNFDTWLIMSNGKKAGIFLGNYPKITTGDEIYIKANYHLTENYVDLVDYIEIKSQP